MSLHIFSLLCPALAEALQGKEEGRKDIDKKREEKATPFKEWQTINCLSFSKRQKIQKTTVPASLQKAQARIMPGGAEQVTCHETTDPITHKKGGLPSCLAH